MQGIIKEKGRPRRIIKSKPNENICRFSSVFLWCCPQSADGQPITWDAT